MAQGIHDKRYQAAIEALRSARSARGLSQTELGRRLGRRQQFVSKYESGERRLDVIEFMEAAEVLDLDWIEVLRRDRLPVDGE